MKKIGRNGSVKIMTTKKLIISLFDLSINCFSEFCLESKSSRKNFVEQISGLQHVMRAAFCL